MRLTSAIHLISLTAFLAGCSYCPPGFKKDTGLSVQRATPTKLISKDEIEEGAQQ
jgi:starvation-inducible outer membrane lipoprotein